MTHLLLARDVPALDRRDSRRRPKQPATREIVVGIAHQKGGVGKSTSAALLAAEIAWLRPEWQVLVEDLDPDQNLTSRWPGDPAGVQLVPPGTGVGNLRFLDTGPGNADQLAQILRRCDQVVVPVRLEPMTMQALGLFLPRLRALQVVNGGKPELAGFLLTHFVRRSLDHAHVHAELEAFARQEGTRILGIVPFLVSIGMRLSTRGHHYRPAAQQLLDVLEG